MSQVSIALPDAFEAWSGVVRDSSRVAPHLPPVEEESFVQIGRGDFEVDASTVTNGEVTIYRVGVSLKSVGITVLKPGYIGFALPVLWREGNRINGRPIRPSSIFIPDRERYCHMSGSERLTFGVILPRDPFIRTLAALQGIDPEDVAIGVEAIDLPPWAHRKLHRQLDALVRTCKLANRNGRESEALENACAQAFGMIAEAFDWAARSPRKTPARPRCPSRIVRRAEERFAEAQEAPVSLADLCAAAGVSKTVLYEAFHQVCGVPPLDYFHKRRLMVARSLLIGGNPVPGAVKQTALTVGLTEFGRFARDYQRLFGELPSVTLNHS